MSVQKIKSTPPNTLLAYWPKGTIMLRQIDKSNAVEGRDNDPAQNMPTVPHLLRLFEDIEQGRIGPALDHQGTKAHTLNAQSAGQLFRDRLPVT